MKALPCLLLAAVIFIFATGGLVAAPPAVELLTATEAAQPNLPMGKGGKTLVPDGPITNSEIRSTPIPGAPQIIVDTPTQGIEVTAPFPVKIRFVPMGGAKIKLETLKVEVLTMIPISLVSRVRPYLTESGINVPEAKIPSGTYNVRIAVADDQGREGSTVQAWTVH